MSQPSQYLLCFTLEVPGDKNNYQGKGPFLRVKYKIRIMFWGVLVQWNPLGSFWTRARRQVWQGAKFSRSLENPFKICPQESTLVKLNVVCNF
jgi:hypothetical protein